MIQIYKPINTNYNRNGDMVLFPSDFTVSAELNGTWSAEMTCPLDDEGRWKYIEDQAVVKAPSFNGEQIFRIISKSKSDSGVTAAMQPIFMDSMNDCFLVDVRPTDKTGQEALDIMTAPNSKYSAESDIGRRSTAYYQFKNLLEAINGGDDNSFLNRWGGEILFDNFKVIINERVGGDYGVELRYGKNIPANGMTEDIDMTAVITRIYPKAYNGYTMTNSGYVDSPLINNYPTVKIGTMTFDDVKMREDASEDDEENGVIVCDTQKELDAALKEKCEEQFEAGLDKPAVTISADMVLLQNTEEYKDFKVLEEVSLGDTIHCINNHLGIVTDARVIALTYDSVLKKVDSVTIGDYEYSYFNNVTSSVNRIDSAVRPDGTLIAEQIKGFIDGAWSQLRLQNTIAKKQDVRAILFEDLDADSETFGALSIGTQGLQISRKRTADGRDWVWTTALTAGGLIANIIKAGIITDSEGKSYWNLDTGEFVMENGTITAGTINSAKITGSQINSTNIRTEDSDTGWDITIGNGQIVSEGEFGLDEKTYKGKTFIRGTGLLGVSDFTSEPWGWGINPNGMDITFGGCQFYVTVLKNTINMSIYNSKYGSISISVDSIIGTPKIEISSDSDTYTTLSPGHLKIVRDGRTIIEY